MPGSQADISRDMEDDPSFSGNLSLEQQTAILRQQVQRRMEGTEERIKSVPETLEELRLETEAAIRNIALSAETLKQSIEEARKRLEELPSILRNVYGLEVSLEGEEDGE